jgi:hypothetical protein
LSAGTGYVCGSQCLGRYCELCGPFERNDHIETTDVTGADREYLDRFGVHYCDVCDSVVQTLHALAKDCSEHGVSSR